MKMVGWPKDWPRYKQACFGSWVSACDMLVGHCQCGAFHKPGEFKLKKDGRLFRYGKQVLTDRDVEHISNKIICPFCSEEMDINDFDHNQECHEVECYHCEKLFSMVIHHTIKYITKQIHKPKTSGV